MRVNSPYKAKFTPTLIKPTVATPDADPSTIDQISHAPSSEKASAAISSMAEFERWLAWSKGCKANVPAECINGKLSE